jgi:hypothetical protein
LVAGAALLAAAATGALLAFVDTGAGAGAGPSSSSSLSDSTMVTRWAFGPDTETTAGLAAGAGALAEAAFPPVALPLAAGAAALVAGAAAAEPDDAGVAGLPAGAAAEDPAGAGALGAEVAAFPAGALSLPLAFAAPATTGGTLGAAAEQRHRETGETHAGD